MKPNRALSRLSINSENRSSDVFKLIKLMFYVLMCGLVKLNANGRNYTPLTIAKNLLSSRTKADTGTKASCQSGHGNGCIVFVNNRVF